MSARRRVNFADVTHVPDFMHAAGLVDVAGAAVKVPTGAYGGRLGTLVATDFLSVANGYGGLIVGSGVTTQAELDRAIAGMRTDFEMPSSRCYTPFYIAIGQRPG